MSYSKQKETKRTLRGFKVTRLCLNKVNKSNPSLEKDGSIQFEPLKKVNISKNFFSEFAGDLKKIKKKNYKNRQKNLLAEQLKATKPRLYETYSITIFSYLTYMR